MATKLSDIPSSPPNDESDGDGEEEEPLNVPEQKPATSNVADILKRLQSSGALLKKPKQEYRCYTCDEDYTDWESLEQHILQHVSVPSVVLDKLPSDDEDVPPSGDEWTDEEDEAPLPQPAQQKTPQKIDISQIMKKTGISIKSPVQAQANTAGSTSALSKLSGLGFTIKKNSTPIKEEKVEPATQNTGDVLQRLGKLGGIKLKLKSDGNNTNTFKVVNGLKDFKTSDDEEDGENDNDKLGDDSDHYDEKDDKEGIAGAESSDEQEAADVKQESNDDEEEIPLASRKIATAIKNAVQNKLSNPKPVPKVESNQPEQVKVQMQPAQKPQGRPAVKQTPRRGPNHPIAAKQFSQETPPTQGLDVSTTSSTPERPDSQGSSSENIVVKKEIDAGNETQSSETPLFSGQIKTERSSPSPTDNTPISTPIIAKVKSESDTTTTTTTVGIQPLFQNSTPASLPNVTTPLLPVTKTEDMTIIEINGDSNDEDDDCCVVSATPAPDIKPVIPKPETVPTSYQPPPPPAYSTSQPSFTSSVLSARLSGSTEKQHNFNWNAPDSKPPLDMLEKTSEDIFDSLLSSKRENSSFSDASEYISLDTLGPQHSCEVCNTRFTSLSLLDDHRRMTGHSSSLVSPSSSTLLPYSSTSNILSSLLPVKQLAEQVGKLSGMGSGPGFTHQQNVMINIQAYPGAGGVMGPPSQPYNSYNPGQNMHSGYQQPSSMYTAPGHAMPGQQMPGQQMPSQYPGQNYMGQQGYSQQYSPQMPKTSYAGGMQSTPYSVGSPLQSMQQAVYGQSPSMMNNQMGQMGPPGMGPGLYVPASSPGGTMKPPTSSAVRIQNIQTFSPGQMTSGSQQMPGDMGPGQVGQVIAPGQHIGGQMPAPGPIRVSATANITGSRPRMPNVRGVRPTIRPGMHVQQGQGRGGKPRMPIKRPGVAPGGPAQKRRTDMLLPGKHDNEDCQVMAMQKQREGLPMIHSVQGAKDKLNLGSQISITKKTVNKEANAMANVLTSRGISVKQKQKSRSPSPERPVPVIPNLGSAVSIKHSSKSSNFSIPESKVGGGMLTCKICKKMFMNSNSLAVHMTNAHPQSKLNIFKCDECPASYPKSLQLQHHKRVFHNVTGPNRELGLPVVDLAQEDNIKRLSSLGIYSFIPLANREQVSGCFGIPVISVHNMQNGMSSGLQALGADGLLSLGPLKPLPNT